MHRCSWVNDDPLYTGAFCAAAVAIEAAAIMMADNSLFMSFYLIIKSLLLSNEESIT